MSTKAHRDAVTGEYVTAEYAAANPATTVSEKVKPVKKAKPVEPVESIEFDIPDDLSELPESHGPAPYRTLLEIWRAVLEPATTGEMRDEPISPQWATKMVTTYPEVRFADVLAIHHGVFDLAAVLAALLDEEIALDDECLNRTSAEEDARENAGHYRSLLAAWQTELIRQELLWRPDKEDAAVTLAVLSEVQQMFLGQQGLVAHLDTIGFQFTDDDQAELQKVLSEARAAFLEGEGESE